ncbi:unannotated protein [freshwater metagenome]|jgi:hypothetical protein|uniref:Unannotated protein n=1 Tax=freshwater metagenome TaxID=449393 RepID=A0A6J7CZY2_9ZZZZ|nr:hypothetical protein [Actinomycetota bacterium]
MRFSIGLTRLPLPQFTWASIDKQVEDTQPAPADLTAELTVKEDDNS